MNVFGKQLLKKVNFGERLAQKRTSFKLSQEALAEAIGTTPRSISRWEHNQSLPQQYYRELLCKVLACTPEELFGSDEKPQASSQPVPLWHVPYARNPYFSGREAILRQIHAGLHAQHQVTVVQSHIVSGMGGIGKTQTVLEYAYQFRSNYQAVLWVGAETLETLMSDYRALAQLFQLPEKESLDSHVLREAVKLWFQQHTDWLLIFDNVENLEFVSSMLPSAHQGHILITTRSQITGTLGEQINLQKMESTEGILFLLRRSKLFSPHESLEETPAPLLEQAREIVTLLDGLPLALDQAGAYIEETACSFSDYLELYTSQRDILLNSRGDLSSHHPASVTTTLSLAFQQVEKASTTAANLLRLCAFLHAEAIPEEFLVQSGETLGPVLQAISSNPLVLNAAIKELRRFSLLYRDPEAKTLSIHRLLQEIIKAQMPEEERKLWMERIIRAMLQITPSYKNSKDLDIRSQSYFQLYMSHVLVCAAQIKKWNILSEDAEEFLHRVIVALQFRGDFAQAQSLALQALSLVEKVFGNNHVKSAPYLNLLAIHYSSRGQYSEARDHFERALTLCEQTREPNHSGVVENLWGLANLFNHQGNYSQAEHYAQRALTIQEQVLGPDHQEIVLILNVLAMSLIFQYEYAQAEALLLRAISICEKTLEKDHFFLGNCSTNLGNLYVLQGNYAGATILYQRALQIYEKRSGPNHVNIATVAQKLIHIYFDQQDYEQARILCQKSLKIYQQVSEQYVNQAHMLIHLGMICMVQGHTHLAKRYVQDAYIILDEKIQVDHVSYQEIISSLLIVGNHLKAQGRRIPAQTCYQRTLIIAERILGSDHPLALQCRNNLEKEFLLPKS